VPFVPKAFAGTGVTLLKALQICIGINHCKNHYRKLWIDLQLVLVSQGLGGAGASRLKSPQLYVGIDFCNWYNFIVSLKLTLKYKWY